VELKVQGTLNGTDYSGGSDFYDIKTFTTSADLNNSDPEQDIAVYIPSTGSIRYLRFTRVNGQGKLGVNGVIYDIKDSINALPIASDDISSICEDNELLISPLDNDIDPQGLPLSLSIIAPLTNGIISVNSGEGRSNGGSPESVADDFPSNEYDNNTGT
jgi:hypothetical protein